MTNAINANFLRAYQSAGQFGKQSATSAKTKSADAADKNLLESFGANADVKLSDAGLSALKLQSDAVDDKDSGAVKADEEKLSAKAQKYLDNLRKKYGDYDFIVSNDMDTSKTAGSTKEYSVMFTTEELEKMADDDEYSDKVMGQVGKAVDLLKGISEKDLGEGVQFSQLGVSIDSEGNMKLFAQLEQMSAEQKERFEAAKEKRAEEQKNNDKSLDDKPEEPVSILFKSADVEASSEEELLAKIFGIKWDDIPEEEALI